MTARGRTRLTGIVVALVVVTAVVLALAKVLPGAPTQSGADGRTGVVDLAGATAGRASATAGQSSATAGQWNALVRSARLAGKDVPGDPSAQVSLTWRSRDSDYVYIARTTSWDAAARVVRHPTPSVRARAHVTVVDAATGLVVRSLSGGNHVMTIRVVDGEAGAGDAYAVTVRSTSGATLYWNSATHLGAGSLTIQG